MSENEAFDREYEGITFKKVGRFFKRGWLRMIIYMLIAIVVTAIIALPIRSFYQSEPVGTFSVEFIYDGVEKGEDPNGGTLNTDNIISTVVLSNAVTAAGLTDVISDIAALRGAMRVEGIEPEEYTELKQAAANGNEQAIAALAGYKVYSTRFDVIVSEPSKLGLSDTQTVQLLDKIFTSYCSDFQRRFSLNKSFPTSVYGLSENAFVEYTDIYDTYVQSFDTIDSYLSTVSSKSHNGDTFNVLRNEITQMQLALGTFNNHVIANNIWIDKDLAASALTENKAVLTAKSKALQDEYEAIHKVVTSMIGTKVETSLGTSITTTVYPDNYEEYVQLELDKLDQIRKVQDQLAATEARLSRINSAVEPTEPEEIEKAELAKEEAERLLKALESSAKTLVAKINSEIVNYADSQYVAQSVKRVRPSSVTRKTVDFNVWLVFGCAALLGILIGGIVTGVKISVNNGNAVKTASAAEEQAEKTETEKNDEEK